MKRPCAMVLAAAVLVAGCAAPPDKSDQNARIEAAERAFGRPFTYFYISSDGALEDAAFIAMSKTTGASGMARELAGLMAAGEQTPIRILVTGPSREKNERVILDAIELQQGNQLPKLHLLFLGNPSYEAKIGAAVRSLGADFSFAPY